MYNRFITRPLSYSQLSQWEYDKEKWYTSYIEGKREPANAAMLYGNVVGDSIGTAGSLVPALIPPGIKEYEIHANLGDVFLFGKADHFCPEDSILHENKTSSTEDRWDQKKVDQHGQLTMYALMLFLRDKIRPEDVTIYLNFIPVLVDGAWEYSMPSPPTYTQFKTKRTTHDIMKYSQYVLQTVKDMDAYIHSRGLTPPTASVS